MALAEIGCEAKPAAPGLVELLRNGDRSARHNALYALAKIRPDDSGRSRR